MSLVLEGRYAALVFLLVWPSVVFAQASAETYFEDAAVRNAAGDSSGALIQIKNALQLDDQHLPSLLLKGRIEAANDDFQAARVSLLRARDSGASSNAIIPLLAEVYLELDDYSALLAELKPSLVTGAAKGELLGYRASAMLASNPSAAAQTEAVAAIGEALAIAPNALAPNIAQTSLLLQRGSYEDAARLAEHLTRLHPEHPKSWQVHALALQANEAWQAAFASYGRAISLKPTLLDARLQHATLALSLGEDEVAEKDLEYLGRLYPAHPLAAYLRSQLAARSGDWEVQRYELQACVDYSVAMGPARVANDRQLTIAAAVASLELGNVEVAYNFLTAHIARNDDFLAVYNSGSVDDREAALLYAGILHELGEHNELRRLVAPWLARDPGDQRVRWLLISAELSSNNVAAATALAESLDRQAVGVEVLEARLAWAQFKKVDPAYGLSALRVLLAKVPDNVSIRMLLAQAYLENRQAPEAIAILEERGDDNAANIAYQNLVAMARLRGGRPAAARKALSAALALDPGDFTSRLNLVRVQLVEGDIVPALQRLDDLLRENPDEPNALLLSAKAEYLRGESSAALRLTEKAQNISRGSIEIGSFLVRLLVEAEKIEQATTLAQQLAHENPTDISIIALYGQVLLQQNSPQKALRAYRIAALNTEASPRSLTAIAQLQMQLGAWADAEFTLSKALHSDSSFLSARIARVELDIKRSEYASAAELAQTLIEAYPETLRAYELAAEALMKLRRHEQAYAASERGLEVGHATSLVLKQYAILMGAQRPEQARRQLQAAVLEHPGDLVLSEVFATHLMLQQRWEDAHAVLSQLVRIQPDNAGWLNNLALTSAELGRPDALELAERAHAKAPEDALINDTLGWLLVQAGKPEDGLAYLREAVARNTTNAELKYHLAFALEALGRRAEARAELQSVVSADDWFSEREAALVLWEAIQ